MSWIEITIIVWLTGFVGGIGVALKDYQSYDRDVLLYEFAVDLVIIFFVWPVISHYIVQYTVIALINILGIKNITIFKYKGDKDE